MKNILYNNIDIKIVLVIIISFLIGYYSSSFTSGSIKLNNTNINKINKRIDDEHNDILNACDNLYNVCEKHWKTEDEIYNKGKKFMPKNHKDTSSEWNNHRQEHIDSLNSIKEMKNKIVKHINEKDTEHFHWLS